ncbi:50S ribosomal protein L31 [candidate division WWE3 bacterium RIFOXYC1_FULL_39_7]|uniref:Large ribosomal subunit protein bL31 n=2 Tax=Katanobacteria TaxID=422282 RepID=A0A1F4X7P2_UNCKA|nr:MAG: 50S ribosomal protein L31 [candidate division WWE3 bacterium RIFOXYC1_FULL_39_7]OGC77704.1 MAG: 50S ribosomal protein L31 [candidate division WWE3 bacterium RIFOXYD1_FULL_39_9]
MKKGIHPNVNKEAIVTCVCGNKFTTISTLPTIQVDICSNCHPFFTGQQKFVDTEGRVDKFRKKAIQIEATKQKHEASKSKKVKKTEEPKSTTPLTLKELMKQMKEEDTAVVETEADKEQA